MADFLVRTYKPRWAALCFILLGVCVTACATPRSEEIPSIETFRSTTPSHAYVSPGTLLLDYEIEGKTYTGIAEWPVSAEPFAFARSTLRRAEGEEARESRRHGTEVAPLGLEEWQAFQTAMVEQITPTEKKSGVLVAFGVVETVISCDYAGNPIYWSPEEKPRSVRICGTITEKTLSRVAIELLQIHIEEQNLEVDYLLFETRSISDDRASFLLIDLANRQSVLLHLPATPAPPVGLSLAGQLTYLVVHGQIISFIKSPLTSTVRLTAGIRQRLYDTAKLSTKQPDPTGPPPPISKAAPMDLDAWETELDELLGRPTSQGTLAFHVDGETYFKRLIESIADAREGVDIRTYIFDNDDYALMIADLLKQRSEEVRVRVVTDAWGSLSAAGTEPLTRQQKRDDRPDSIVHYLRRGSSAKARYSHNPWMTGDHFKTTLIDRETLFLGGMNIGREYRHEWHDLMAELQGPVVTELQHEFDRAWNLAGPFGDYARIGRAFKRYKPEHVHGEVPLRVLFTKTGKSEIYKAQVAAIRNSQSYIFIQNSYFSDDEILDELVRARHRGVDVRVLLPAAGNHGIMNESNLVATQRMLEHGIRVFRYPKMSHVKAAIYDGWVCFGSANLDRLSLRVNQEANIATSNKVVLQDLLEQVFRPDFAAATEVTELEPLGWGTLLAEAIADHL